MLGGSLMRGGGETRVATPAASALRDHKTIAGLREVVQHFAGGRVVNHGSYRRLNVDRIAVVAFAIATLAVPAALGFVFGIKTKMEQRVVVLAGHHNHVAAAASVATAGSTARDKLFATERKTAVAAISGFHGADYFIDEHFW